MTNEIESTHRTFKESKDFTVLKGYVQGLSEGDRKTYSEIAAESGVDVVKSMSLRRCLFNALKSRDIPYIVSYKNGIIIVSEEDTGVFLRNASSRLSSAIRNHGKRYDLVEERFAGRIPNDVAIDISRVRGQMGALAQFSAHLKLHRRLSKG